MAINRKSRRDVEDDDYYDEEKVTRRPADDDDEDDAPRKPRSRRRDEDDEDEAPRKSSRRRRDDDDEDEDEAPRKSSRRSRRDDDDEDEAPRKSSRRSRDDDDEDDAPRKSSRRSRRDDDDEDIDPDDKRVSSSVIQSGWDVAKKRMSESGSFTNDFRFDEEPQVVKFLNTEPLVYQQHWLDARSGKKSFVCLGQGCPLCKAGDEPSSKYAWPVLNFGVEASGSAPVTQLLNCGTKLAKQLQKQDQDRRNGPLDKLYWALSKTGAKQSTSYVMEPVKERDLFDDWEIDADEAADAVDNAKVPGEEAINVTSREELLEIARDL